MASIVETLQANNNHRAAGPGEVLSELALGCRRTVRQGESAIEAQEFFNRYAREITIIALANPGIPWDTGSTEVPELTEAEREATRAFIF